MNAVTSYIQTQPSALQNNIPTNQTTDEKSAGQNSTNSGIALNQSNAVNNIESNKNSKSSDTTTRTLKDTQNLVDKLNNTVGSLSKSIKFGVDKNDVFYVSVISSKTGKILSRYPAEQVEKALLTSQNHSGLMLDTKG
jgi:flagellar protein FlaG